MMLRECENYSCVSLCHKKMYRFRTSEGGNMCTDFTAIMQVNLC